MHGVIDKMKKDGYDVSRDLIAAQNDTVVVSCREGTVNNHLAPVLDKYRVPIQYLSEPPTEWIRYEPKGKMLVLDRVFEKQGIQIPKMLMGKNVIHMPTVKTHIFTGTTGSMKNAFGGLLNLNRHWTHSVIHETLVDLLRIQKEIHPGVFAVMDGTIVGDGPGPRCMRPHVKNYILASDDCVAIDAIAAKMMGFDPMTIEYIRVAHEDGLGVGDPRDIEIVGDDVSSESWGFRVGDNGVSRIGDLLWFSPLKVFQKAFFRTPLVHLFILGSETYHDYYRWPLRDRRVFETWKRDTAWGRLFESYGAAPASPVEGPAGRALSPT
jgi:hypothetical protein